MIADMTFDALRALALMGASLKVNAKSYHGTELRAIALGLQDGAYLKICNSGSIDTDELRAIVLTKRKQIILA